MKFSLTNMLNKYLSNKGYITETRRIICWITFGIIVFLCSESGPLVIFKSFEGEITDVKAGWVTVMGGLPRKGSSQYAYTYFNIRVTYEYFDDSKAKYSARNVDILSGEERIILPQKGQHIRGKCTWFHKTPKVQQAYIDGDLYVEYPASSERNGIILIVLLTINIFAIVFLTIYKRRKWPKKKPQIPADIIKDKYARYYKDWNYTVYLWKDIAVISVVFSDTKGAYCRYFSIEKPKEDSDEYYESLADDIRAHVSNYESNEIIAL